MLGAQLEVLSVTVALLRSWWVLCLFLFILIHFLRRQWQRINVCSLSIISMSIPWKAEFCMKTEAAQCHRNVASLPPAAWALFVDDHSLWVWWECRLMQILTGKWCCRRVGVEWELGDRWTLSSSELSKLFCIAVYPVGSVWLWGKFCHQHLFLSDGSSVAPAEHNAREDGGSDT